jgi:Ser/Thr protein kinase RdoA (MazF antagonist)
MDRCGSKVSNRTCKIFLEPDNHQQDTPDTPAPRSAVTRAAIDPVTVVLRSLMGCAGRSIPQFQLLDACGERGDRLLRDRELGLKPRQSRVVHGDFHPGNWRRGDGAPVVLDFADAHLGNPVFDGLRAIDYLPAGRRRTAASAWIAAWTAAAPRSRPAEALRIAEPLAHLAYAVRYQEFLDNIEPSERVYHLGDPAASIRHALASARTGTGPEKAVPAGLLQ